MARRGPQILFAHALDVDADRGLHRDALDRAVPAVVVVELVPAPAAAALGRYEGGRAPALNLPLATAHRLELVLGARLAGSEGGASDGALGSAAPGTALLTVVRTAFRVEVVAEELPQRRQRTANDSDRALHGAP